MPETGLQHYTSSVGKPFQEGTAYRSVLNYFPDIISTAPWEKYGSALAGMSCRSPPAKRKKTVELDPVMSEERGMKHRQTDILDSVVW